LYTDLTDISCFLQLRKSQHKPQNILRTVIILSRRIKYYYFAFNWCFN